MDIWHGKPRPMGSFLSYGQLHKKLYKDATLPSLRDFAEVREIEAQVLDRIKPNETYFGCYDSEWQEPFVMPYSTKRRIYTIVGMAGWGKTQLAKTMVFDNFHRRFGENVWAIDPKPDLPNLDKPLDDKELAGILARFGIKTIGYKAKFIYPEYTSIIGARGEGYTISLSDFAQLLDKETQHKTLSEFFMLEEKKSAIAAVQRVLIEKMPKSVAEMKKLLEADWRKTYGILRRPPSRYAMLQLDDLVSGGKLTDDETLEKQGKKPFDYPLELVKNQIVVQQIPKETEKLHMASLYVKMAIQRLIDDREIYRRSRGMRGYLSRGFTFYIDEIDLLAPNKGSRASKVAIEQIATKGRALNLSMVCCAQAPDQIAKRIVENSSAIFIGGVTAESTAQLLRLRHIPNEVIAEAVSYSPREKATDKIKSWLAIFPENPDMMLQKFYPMPSCSQPLGEEDMW